MVFNDHSKLVGMHAFLSPSSYHWLHYDEDKLDRMWTSAMAAKRGTEMHNLASELIRLGVKLPQSSKTFNMYVNDGIGYRMTPEQPLYYSDNCFGTADCAAFRRNQLRIHDLKTGITPASMDQMRIYAGLFCLEYKFRPFDIKIELRLYQLDGVKVLEPDPDEIMHVMDRIRTYDKRINDMRMEAAG